MPNHEVALTLENVGVYYKRRARFSRGEQYWALKDVSFKLYHGETLGVIGRNGVGKSTLLRVLAGIISPNRGTFKSCVGRVSLLTLQLGFVPHLTGRENAILGGILLGMKRQMVQEKMKQIIDFSGLGDFVDEPVGTYSAGMRARLAFAVAIHADPDVLLIDEVLGVGDDEFKQKSTLAMKERISSDETVVIVSHNINTIRELCDRLIWIEQGVTKMEGDTESVLKAYMGAGK